MLFIRAHRYRDLFEGSWYTQLDVGEHTCWTMGAPVEETILINRKGRPPTGAPCRYADDWLSGANLPPVPAPEKSNIA